MSWPPTLVELKLDAGIDDTRDDDKLQLTLDAAVAFVQRVRSEFAYPDVPEVGDIKPLTVIITDSDDVPVNAATIALVVELPDGTTVTGTIANPPVVTGKYTYDLVTTQAGAHVARWTSTVPTAVMASSFTIDSLSGRPAPPKDLALGTIRLATRWHARRRSPDALLSMGDLGTARIPNFDPDIERMLGIGRYRGPVFA